MLESRSYVKSKSEDRQSQIMQQASGLNDRLVERSEQMIRAEQIALPGPLANREKGGKPRPASVLYASPTQLQPALSYESMPDKHRKLCVTCRTSLQIELYSNQTSAKRGDKMDFAVDADVVEHATSRHLTVDRHGDRRPDVSVLDQLICDAGKAFVEVADQLAHRASWHVYALDAAGKFS
jgi:hypothetical protein